MIPRIFALFSLLLPASLHAQPASNQVQPDHLPFGVVYTGAIVEGSFMVFEAGTDKNIPFEVTTPPGIEIISKLTHVQDFGGSSYVCGSVYLAIKTLREGGLKEEVKVTLGKSQVKVPVTATIKPVRNGLKNVLVTSTPFNRHSTSHGEHYSSWVKVVKDSYLNVSYLNVYTSKPVLRDLELKKYDSILVGCDGLYHLTPEDVKKLRTYAHEGGTVILAANYFFRDTVKQANLVLAGSGIEFQDVEGRIPDDRATLQARDIDIELQQFGVKTLCFHRGSPIAITDKAKGKVLVKTYGVGNPEDGFVAVASVGKGRIFGLGTSLWWNWIIPNQADGSDNARLLEWLLVSK